MPAFRLGLRKIAYACSPVQSPGSENSPSAHPPGGISIHLRFGSLSSCTAGRPCAEVLAKLVQSDGSAVRATRCPIGIFVAARTGYKMEWFPLLLSRTRTENPAQFPDLCERD